MRPIRSDVIAAITARKVMYWNTRRKPNSGETDCSHCARLSSMGRSFLLFLSRLAEDRFDHALHLHEARALHEHARGIRQLAEHGGVERLDRFEMRAPHGAGLVAQREQPV